VADSTPALAIDSAEAAGARRLYYTGGVRADDPGFVLGADYHATEDVIRESGLRYTVLRNGWYIENYLAAMPGGVLTAAVGDGLVAPAGRREFAGALAAALDTDGHDNQTYSLTGDTYADLADAMAKVLDKPVTYRPAGAEQYRAMLTGAGLDAETAGFLAALDADLGAGIMAYAGDDLTA
jgi:NAD(P)H dehydrogenase (quinone)